MKPVGNVNDFAQIRRGWVPKFAHRFKKCGQKIFKCAQHIMPKILGVLPVLLIIAALILLPI